MIFCFIQKIIEIFTLSSLLFSFLQIGRYFMEHSLSHTFKFETQDIFNTSIILNNLITISEYEARKHYIQYLQCQKRETSSGTVTIYYRYIDIKVDRKYYLEIANIMIDDTLRCDYFFSIIGKRCLGATQHAEEYFLLDTSINQKTLASYLQKNKHNFSSILVEKSDTNLNRYLAYFFCFDGKEYAYIFQENISQRKIFSKAFYLELGEVDKQRVSKMRSNELKIELLFSVIGKIHFNAMSLERLEASETEIQKEMEKLVLKEPLELEYKTRLYESRLYNQLKEYTVEIEAAYLNLYHRSLAFLHNPQEYEILKLFSISVIGFISHLREVKKLDELVSYFTAIHLFADDGKLSYLLEKKDKDFIDIFLYMLECLAEWNNQLSSAQRDLKAFNIATIDLQNSLKYLFETYLQYTHQYHCKDAKKESQEESKDSKAKPVKLKQKCSAKEFCQKNIIAAEVIDELCELEGDIAVLFQETMYSGFLKDPLHKFFTGYTSVFNEHLELRNLAYSLTLIMSSLENASHVEDEEMLLALLQSLTASLINWSKSVFIEQSAEDIRYMDELFYEYIAQIEIVLSSGSAQN